MATNGTYPVYPRLFRGSNAWKSRLVAGGCGLGGLALVLGIVIWIVWFHTQQTQLKDPQRVVTEKYFQQKKGRKKGEKKIPWWQFWAKKGE
ncbi:hypothetical protein PITC_030680 [Penicillium italicum]|uniref:Uncharacterized protein n=1 Tax=Penicillium italicum TaxID=40296 RepID=A0A0A2L972_PENIT|nr:hypothetical protein PITC_030680 [Penicillium italicum]